MCISRDASPPPIEIEKTLAYAKMIERSGCCCLAVHGRTRDQKDLGSIRADWDAIRAVKQVNSAGFLSCTFLVVSNEVPYLS